MEVTMAIYLNFQKFKNKYNKVLAVAICYDFNNKEHTCKIEEIK